MSDIGLAAGAIVVAMTVVAFHLWTARKTHE